MSVVQALAAMLSAGADASSRLGAASVAANASNANANAALQGDIYRSNTQGQIANRGIESENQRAAAELALRGRLANNQMGLESGRLALQRQQLGLDSRRFGHERDLSLADFGKGPYAPNTGMDDEFKSQFAAASPQEALAMYAKRMLLGNASNPRMMAGMGGLFSSLLQNQSSVDERQWKEKMATSPTAMGMSLAPVIGGMEGMTPEKFGPAMQQLLTSIGVGGAGGGTAPNAAITPQSMDLSQATQTLSSPQTAELLKALGIGDQSTPWQIGESIGERAGSLTPADLTEIQRIMAARLKAKPDMFQSGSPDHPGVKLLRKLLESPVSSMNPAQMQSDYATQRQEYYKNGGDPRTTMMFGIPRLW